MHSHSLVNTRRYATRHTHTHTHDVNGQHDIDRIALCITDLCPLRLSCDIEAFCTGLSSHLVHVFVVFTSYCIARNVSRVVSE